MNKLEGKVAVITGGNSGIGFAIASRFVAEGAKVVITGRQQAALDEAVNKLGKNATAIKSDTADLAATVALTDKVKSQFGNVDILVVNAGVSVMQPVGQITEDAYDKIIDTNLKGAIFTTEKFLPLLKDGSSIIHVTSISSFAVGIGTSIYAASKAALTAYSKTAAIELAPRKIRVNTIAPGMTQTEMFSKTGFTDETLHSFIKGKMPLKRYAQPSEVANLALFLASDDSTFISGGEYVIDGAASVNEPFRA